MERKDFFSTTLKFGLGAGLLAALPGGRAQAAAATVEETLQRVQADKQFVENWLTDLLDTMEQKLDPAVRAELMAGCGRGCFRRHAFKQEIAAKGKGNLEKLLQALQENFEVWREDGKVHIRYGKVSPGCYCPAARFRPPRPGDLHCECTRATHQTIFETALGRPIRVEILQSVRRGGPTCHFLVHV